MDETADMGALTSLEAMRSTGTANSTTGKVVKKTTTVNGTAVKRHTPARSTTVKQVGAHTVKHSSPKK